MKRIIVAAIFCTGVSSLSFGQVMQRDSSAALDTTRSIIDTTGTRTNPAPAPADTITKKLPDTTAARPDTTISAPVSKVDTLASPLLQDTSRTPAKTPEIKQSAGTKSITPDPYGYKDVRWGMTLQDVKYYLVDHDNVDEYAIEPITNGFEYPGMVAGVKATIAYQFDGDRLYIVRLALKVIAESRFDFLDSFEEYQSTLEAKYGKPSRSGFHKIDDQYLNTIESIQLGFAKKYALWEFEGTYIVLVLSGRNKRLELHITYVSRAIFDEMKDRIETLKLEDF